MFEAIYKICMSAGERLCDIKNYTLSEAMLIIENYEQKIKLDKQKDKIKWQNMAYTAMGLGSLVSKIISPERKNLKLKDVFPAFFEDEKSIKFTEKSPVEAFKKWRNCTKKAR